VAQLKIRKAEVTRLLI